MNDSNINDNNNNIFGNNSVSQQPSSFNNNSNMNFNSMSVNNNFTNGMNDSLNANTAFSNNLSSQSSQNIQFQSNQNMGQTQFQNNFNSQINNQNPNFNNFNQTNNTSFNSTPMNNMNNQSTIQSSPVFSSSYSQQNQVNNNYITDEELLRAFVGKNYEKLTIKSFNFAGFFFTTFYMFYRKMYGYAILMFLLDLVVLNVIKMTIVTLAFNVIVGLLVNKLYISFARKKIRKIKINNTYKSADELRDICTVKGGTSVGSIFLGLLLEIVIAIGAVIIMGIFGLASGFGGLISSFANGLNFSSNGTYDGMIMTDTSVNIANEFSITVPGKFENESSDYEYEYNYSSGNGIFDKCKVTMSVPEGYSNAENLINQMSLYYVDDNPTEVTKTNINNIDWYWFSLNDGFGETYYYGTSKNNKVFLLEYDINEDAASDCDSYRQQIINSIISK